MTREGARPEVVIAEIHGAGGLASIAHPGKLGDDALVQAVVDAGLDAVEVFHPDHTGADEARYEALASRLGLLTTGGSDYHGPGGPRAGPGSVTLSVDRFAALRARVSEARA